MRIIYIALAAAITWNLTVGLAESTATDTTNTINIEEN